MREKRIESGMDTEAIKELLRLSLPPRRKKGEGISAPEYANVMQIGKDTARKRLFEREDLTAVLMRGPNGKKMTVFLPIVDAEEKYPDWIINPSETS